MRLGPECGANAEAWGRPGRGPLHLPAAPEWPPMQSGTADLLGAGGGGGDDVVHLPSQTELTQLQGQRVGPPAAEISLSKGECPLICCAHF